MATRLGDWPVEELPCVQVDMSLLLIMAGQFCPGYSASIFSQATPYISISISSLVQALSANLLQTFSETREKKRERERGTGRERQRAKLRSCWVLASVLFPVSPRSVDADSNRKMPKGDVVVKISASWTTYTHAPRRLNTDSTSSPMSPLLSETHLQLKLQIANNNIENSVSNKTNVFLL